MDGHSCGWMAHLATVLVAAAAGPSFADGAASAGAPPSRGVFLLVYDPLLRPAAEAWAAYRAADGWQVITRAVESTADQDATGRELQAVIRERHASWRQSQQDRAAAGDQRADHERFMVMLLGDADSGAASGGIPTWRFAQTEPTIRDRRDPMYATDDPYQLMDDDAAPDVALGRVPARDNEQALGLLERIRAYEADREPGSWRRRVVYVAGEGHFGFIDRVLESLFKQMVARFVPDEYDVSMTYARCGSPYCPPPSQLKPTVLSRLSESSLLFNYVGHGHPTGLDSMHWAGKRLRILEAKDLAGLECEGQARPIALMTCCSTGWYDLPDGAPSLGESLLFDRCGPVAVIAGSRPTHPYANALHQKNVTQALLGSDAATVGELDLTSTQALLDPDETDRQLELITQPLALAMKWRSTTAELRAMHVRLYNLLGDPATRIARPGGEVLDLVLDGTMIRGRVPGMNQGQATVTVRTAVTSMAREQDLVAVQPDDDPELEAKAAHNYPLANDRVLGEYRGAVRDGEFAVPVEAAVRARGRVVRVHVVGLGPDGTSMDAFGSLRLAAP